MSGDLFDGVTQLSRNDVQQLCDFRVPDSPKWQLGRYTPPGPIGAAYINAMGPIDAIMGPGGSGKTVASIWKAVKFSIEQMPICTDGVIRVKGTVIRDNYRSLYRTTLQTWLEVFPTTRFPNFAGGQDRPAVHTLELSTVRNIDGVRREVPVTLRVEFFAVADVNYELLFKSYETSWAWATEADGIDHAAIPFFFSRTARYPSNAMLPPGTKRPRVALVDFNPPDPEHKLYQACLRGSFKEDFDANRDVKTVNFFRQPSGLADNAENRAGKSREEYQAEMNTMTRDAARRMVEGMPGRVKSGLPVYDSEFDYDRHVSQVPLEILRDQPFHIGFDQGGGGGSAGTPAAVLFQIAPSGQIRINAEVVADPGTGVERFLDQLIPVLTGPFAGVMPGEFFCDPAGFFGGDSVYGTLAWAEIVAQALGHRVYPAPSQEWTSRREALALPMMRFLSAGTPKLMIDPRCATLIRGLNGAYKYGKRHDGLYNPLPTKNLESNAVEAAQYGVLGKFGLAGTISALAQGDRAGNVVAMRRRAGGNRVAATGFRVFD